MNAITKRPERAPAIAPAIENVSRRKLLKGLAAAGSFILAARLFPHQAMAYVSGADGMPHGTVNDPRVFVAIDPSGTVSIVAHRSEMGTGARTSLPMIIADEMEADWARVRVVQAPGDEPRFGNQDTDGSRSTRHFLEPMRQCGAAARMMLEAAAAKAWSVPPGEVAASNHEVVHAKSGRRMGYGELAQAASAMPVPAANALKLKDPKDFRYVGKGEVAIVDLFDITTGRAAYGIDVRLKGMKYAVLARPPVVGGKLVSFDDKAALAVPGVERVLKVEGWPWPSKFQPLGGVAVIARNTGAAIKGRDALNVTWDNGANADYDSEAYRTAMTETARRPGKTVRNDGDIEAALKGAVSTVTGEYYLPHLAHASMEPPVATALVADGKCEVWAPVQSPGGTREDLAKTLDLPLEKVTVNVTLLGGGFGRKSKCDYVLEAALLSRALNAPVRVQWTREDDIRHDFYHTVSLERIEAGIDKAGKVVGWRHRSVAPTLFSTFKPDPKEEQPLELGMGFIELPFDIPNVRCEVGEAAAHTRIGWFRSVSNIPHAFAVQSMVGEIAAATKRDQKEVLLELIGPPRIVDASKGAGGEIWNYVAPWSTYPNDTGRLRRVVELAAEKAGWDKQLPAGSGMGIAAHRSFLSYVATVVQVAVDGKGALTVEKVDTAIDCGFCVNPERVRSQLEGAAIFGLSLARFGEVSFKAGSAQQGNFDDYPVVRIDESPRLTNVHIVPAAYEVPSSGVGEPGVPPVAPALCNAIFAATGKRIRRLPIGKQLET